MPWLVDVSTVEAMVERIEKSLWATGQQMAVDVLRSEFAHAVEMHHIPDRELRDFVRCELTIPNHQGSINT
jgi:hypothetical protein